MLKKEKNVLWILIFVLILIAAAIRINFFRNKIESDFEESILNQLTDITLYQEYFLEHDIGSKVSTLNNFAQAAVTIGNEEYDIITHIKNFENENGVGFKSVFISSPEGVSINKDGDRYDFSSYEIFEETLKGQTVIKSNIQSILTNEKETIISVPVYVDDEIEGIIISEIDVSSIEKLLFSSFGESAYSYIIDANGDIIIKSQNNYALTENNVFETFKNSIFYNDETIETIKEKIAQRKVFTVEYNIDGKERVAQVRPIDGTELSLFFAVPTNVLEKDINLVQEAITLLFIEVILIVVFVIICALYLQHHLSKRVVIASDFYELTSIYNMNRFKKEVKRILTENDDKRFAIVKVDIINFKAINEIYGFEMGNDVVKKFVDIGKNVEIPFFMQSRCGPDELLLFGPYDFFVNLEEHRLFYEKVFRESMLELKNHEFGFRYGRYLIDEDDKDVDGIVNKVTMAHHFTKKQSGTIIVDYNEEFKLRIIKATEITNKMHSALNNNEFKVYLQPKYEVESGLIIGAEALVRWQQSNGKFIFPDEFIPVFEKNRFVVELDMYMLSKVCLYLKNRLENNEKCVPISVNFSRLHLYNIDTIERIISIVDEKGVPRNLIEIELTESASIDGKESVVNFEKELHENGFQLAMDDFGAGYSSFDTLQKIRFDVIKLDRTFMSVIDVTDERKLIIKTILKMVNGLGMKSVAEGVETKEQLDFLTSAGCDIVQGYYFSKPIPISDFDELLKKEK